MSAVAHTSIDHTNIASVQLNNEPAVTSISVCARIEYIQRFSKQAVLVIDEHTEVYTQAARQYLISLSKDKSNQESNVAFVSASVKLNDIQMRCRLIEQLFANTLFDPEKSLAVSVLNLSKQSKDSITIVVEHAHALSLQMKYELCQLVDVANKTHSKINVVIFGKDQAAQDAAKNRTIFKNKLAVIDAKSGQLFSLDHTRFNQEGSILTNKVWPRLVFAVVLIATLIGLSWFILIEYDDFSLSQLPVVNSDNKPTDLLTITSKQVNDIKLVNKEVIPKNNLAKAAEIHAALLSEESFDASIDNLPAKTTDILQALSLDKVEGKNPFPLTIESQVKVINSAAINNLPAELNATKAVNEESPQKTSQLIKQDMKSLFDSSYYLNLSKGYVVQLVGFTDMSLLERFTNKYTTLEYYSYQKRLNGKLFVVLTTKVFETKEQAREALEALPTAIIERGVWVKALSTVHGEINKV